VQSLPACGAAKDARTADRPSVLCSKYNHL
jgi:hypothetical protein